MGTTTTDIRTAVVAAIHAGLEGEDIVETYSKFDEGESAMSRYRCPYMVVSDQGDDRILIDDGTYRRISFTMVIRLKIEGGSESNLESTTCGLINSVKDYLDTEPSLHANLLTWIYTESDYIVYWKEGLIAEAGVNTVVTYYETKATSE